MARKKAHEEHANHEAWAIPYGDLVTLLLAFFVVMYAVSSVNEGKYRVLADSMAEAFGGAPRSMKPLQLGKVQQRGAGAERNTMIAQRLPRNLLASNLLKELNHKTSNGSEKALGAINSRVQEALGELILKKLVVVKQTSSWLEVEINADILFDSGTAQPKEEAIAVIQKVARVLSDFPNGIHIEGHTDNRPISTDVFPSNWELSAARAASVAHILTATGVLPSRLAVVGYGEQRPKGDNSTLQGRAINRRVVLLVIASSDDSPSGISETSTPS